MTNQEEQRDLVVLAADKDMEFAVRGIISRHKSLQIREIKAYFLVHSKHDPGCRNEPEKMLRSFCPSHQYALVLLDHEGSGAEKKKREEIEAEIEAVLNKNGWSDRAAAIVIEPELEAWVWSTLRHMWPKSSAGKTSQKNYENGCKRKPVFGQADAQNRLGPKRPCKRHYVRSECQDRLRYLKNLPKRLASGRASIRHLPS